MNNFNQQGNRSQYNGQKRPDNRNGGSYNKPRTSYQLPADYLSDGYFDHHNNEKDTIKLSLIVELPRQIAAGFMSEDVSYRQLRKQYETVLNINTQVKTDFYTMNEAKVKLAEMIPKVTNAFNKQGTTHVTKSFLDFIVKNIEAVNTKEDLDAFHRHFQAVVGFSKDNKK